MKNKLRIAAAGSGKTTMIVNESISTKERVLITTFTENNAAEIKNKIIKKIGFIPDNIVIQTWFSFLIQHGAKPYQSHLYNKKIKGLILVESKSGIKKRGKFPIYYKEEEVDKHYFSIGGKIYSDKLSKFVVKCNKESKGEVINRISKAFPKIYIDEIQDLAGYDLKIVELLLRSDSALTMVGDPRQVTYTTHFATKYKKYENGKIADFIEKECKSCNCIIDTTTLNHSYRNNKHISDFACNLYPDLPKVTSKHKKDINQHEGIFLVKKKDEKEYILQYNPQILKYNNSIKPELNFGSSKGMGFDRVVIYPTAKIIKYLQEGKLKDIKSIIAKFYVALTRAKLSVAIIYDYEEEINYIDGVKKWKNNVID